jgi:hypothetical protein
MATTKKKATRKRLKTLVIKESRWIHFGSNQTSMLYAKKRPTDRTGNMCCLGFLAQACGAKASQINGRCAPSNVPDIQWPKGVLKGHQDFDTHMEDSQWTGKAMSINDAMDIRHSNRPFSEATETTFKERKDALKKHFVKIGFKLVFVP